MKAFIIILLFISSNHFNLMSQTPSKNTYKFFESRPNKGKIFTAFGWNGSVFTNSDIHFKGKNYDFTLKNVVATDRQSPFSIALYFGPTTITIPQYNFKLGYFFNNNFFIALNIDHLKYVMTQDQQVNIDGKIKNTNTIYDHHYIESDEIVLTKDFLTFEHTDGLNYLNLEVNRFDNLLKLIHLENKWIEVNISEGLSAGVVIPRTNVRLWHKKRNDQFYLSGYGFSANVDLNITFLQYFFIQYGLKAGFIGLPAIHTSKDFIDTANQNFGYLQYGGTFGLKVKIANY